MRNATRMNAAPIGDACIRAGSALATYVAENCFVLDQGVVVSINEVTDALTCKGQVAVGLSCP